MEVIDLGMVTVDKPGTLLELGNLEFTKNSYQITAGPRSQNSGSTTQMLDQSERSRLLVSPLDSGLLHPPARP